VNAAAGLFYHNNQLELYLTNIESFLNRYKHIVNELYLEIALHNSEDVRRSIHTFKGLAGTLGAFSLYALVEELEKEAGSNPSSGLTEKLNNALVRVNLELSRVLHSFERLAAVLRNIIQENENKETKAAASSSPLPTKEIIKKMLTYVNTFDSEAVRLFPQFKSELEQSLPVQVTAIGEALMKYDFEKAKEILVTLE
jgi:two-component system sensor histidine kinase/response regulator